jgi:hypothetical protein
MKDGKILRREKNTILAPYCDNIVNHDINEGIIKLVTLMVKHNKIITNFRVLHVYIRTLLNKPYNINVANIAIPSSTFTQQFLHWSIYEFENVFPLYLMFT